MNDRVVESMLNRWRDGKALGDAVHAYGDNPEAIKHARNARKSIRQSKRDADRHNAIIAANPAAAFSIVSDQVTQLFDLGRAHYSRLAALCDRLRSSEFDAVGFRVDDRGDDEPVVLPAFMLHPEHAHVKRSGFRGRGREYVDVRICQPVVDATAIMMAKRGPGRPSPRDDIDRATEALESQGVSLDGPPWPQITQHIHQVGVTLGLVAFRGKGPDPETIRRRLVKRMASKPTA